MSVRLVCLPAIVISLTVEGWLTAPMSASSALLFFIGGVWVMQRPVKVRIRRAVFFDFEPTRDLPNQ